MGGRLTAHRGPAGQALRRGRHGPVANAGALVAWALASAHGARQFHGMKTMILLLAWCLLLVLCWPLALSALVLWPLAWLLLLPLRLVGITCSALLALLQAVLFLPARVLGWRPAVA